MMLLVRNNNAEGREVLAHANDRLTTLYRQLASPMLSERETDVIRGRVAELLKLIDDVNNTGVEHE